MKRVVIIALSFLCAIVCSCKKEPQDLLIGDWEVSITVQYEANIGGGITVEPVDGGTWYYTFGENGRGRMVDATDATRRYNFTYEYDGLFNEVLFRRENESKDSVLEIDVLTKDSFVFRNNNVSAFGILTGVATYNGKRIK